MFGLGAPELLIILGILIVVFGAGKIADLGGALGKSVREFRQATDDTPGTTTTTTTLTTPTEKAVVVTPTDEQNKTVI